MRFELYVQKKTRPAFAALKRLARRKKKTTVNALINQAIREAAERWTEWKPD